MEPAYLRRNTQRGTYDVESAKAVFDDCFIAHVSYVDDGLPACMPMIALLARDAEVDVPPRPGEAPGDEPEQSYAVYLHGHPSTRIVELVRRANRQPDEDGQTPPPVKVCITATKVDGLALSSAPNGHTFNYRSATVHGTCSAVTDKAVKRQVMRRVTNHIVSGRWEEVNPVASFQVSLVYVIRVRIDRLSVKTRTGPPGIQPRDRESDGPDNSVKPWAGVVPLWEQLGVPVDNGLTPGADVSENLEAYIRTRNERMRSYAEGAARE